jgi:uncharacterized protein
MSNPSRRRERTLFAATGGTGGYFAGITGVGGGAIMIPFLTGPLGMPQHRAHGTSLAVIVFAALAGLVVYGWTADINWTLTGILLLGSVVGAYVGARGVQALPAMRLRQVFGLFLLVIAVRMLLVQEPEPWFAVSGIAELGTGAIIGLAGGLAAGALGVGGGAIFVPGLVLALGAGQHEAQGVSLAVIVLTASVGAMTHYRHGTLDLRAAAWIAPISVPTGFLGALTAAALGGFALQRIFAGVILAVSIQMLVSATMRIRTERSQRRTDREVAHD